MPSPRERMVISAALLIRERGAHPTAIADVLEHSGAPRGSAYHYFPGGRTQLLCEAIDYAGEYIASEPSHGVEFGVVARYKWSIWPGIQRRMGGVVGSRQHQCI